MPGKHREVHFEEAIVGHLTSHGWLPGDSRKYDRKLALYPEDVIGWIRDTQTEEWAKIERYHKDKAETMLLERLAKVLDREGSLAVLRHGFKDVSARFVMCQFRPAKTMNPTTLERYRKVRLRVVRQLRYSEHHENAIDLVLFVNGIPVATLELKSDFTQSVRDAIWQYKTDRLPKDPKTRKEEPLLAFKKRAIVHFAVSMSEVWMTTELKGKDTKFLPFNMGNDGAAGNPDNPDGYPVSYFWERVLQRDAFLEILGKYVHLEKKEERLPNGSVRYKETLIFPRFHQWDCVTKLIETVKREKAGHRYLIQHSAGSGKTNTISWLAHQLSSLHDDENRKIFDSVIVITDRTVLDRQLQEAIYQFEHKTGVIAKITGERSSKSSQLADALASRKPIIIVTIQTFPYVLEEIRKKASLRDRTFAIIADEAHSSQTGNTAKKLRQVLTSEAVDQWLEGKDEEEREEIDAEEILAMQVQSGLFPKNISYFAFTATPKSKTLELFGRLPDPDSPPSDENKPEPFHVYTMEQAIDEEFILDILKNYTSYKMAFKLAYKGQDLDDRKVEKDKALKSLMNWVRLQPTNIRKKTEIIVEHFRQNVMWRLNGKAKAMVVAASRKEAVRYKLAMDQYLREKGYRDLGVLVAFSGDVEDKESGPEPFNEKNLNPGLGGRDLRDAFDTDEYNIMIVANKFQTGFNQPKLMAMYVDKKLSGVSTVQTLSRLNRTYPGKDTTFILDFVNDPEQILADFRRYYRKAELSGVSDPNVIHDLADKLDRMQLYTEAEVDRFAKAYVHPKTVQKELVAMIHPVVRRIRDEEDKAKRNEDKVRQEELKMFRKDMGSFVRVYDFLSQIYDYGSTDLEKRSIFYRALLPYLNGQRHEEEIDLSNVDMTHYNLRKVQESDLNLKKDGDDPKLHGIKAVGSGIVREPEPVYLSQVIQQLNELFEGDLTEADVVNYAYYIRDKMMESKELRQQAEANTKERLEISPDFERELQNAVIDAYESHANMSQQILGNSDKKKRFGSIVVDLIYRWMEEQKGQNSA